MVRVLGGLDRRKVLAVVAMSHDGEDDDGHVKAYYSPGGYFGMHRHPGG